MTSGGFSARSRARMLRILSVCAVPLLLAGCVSIVSPQGSVPSPLQSLQVSSLTSIQPGSAAAMTVASGPGASQSVSVTVPLSCNYQTNICTSTTLLFMPEGPASAQTMLSVYCIYCTSDWESAGETVNFQVTSPLTVTANVTADKSGAVTFTINNPVASSGVFFSGVYTLTIDGKPANLSSSAWTCSGSPNSACTSAPISLSAGQHTAAASAWLQCPIYCTGAPATSTFDTPTVLFTVP